MVLNGLPMCTAFSTIQILNRVRMGEKRWKALWVWEVRHRRCAIELYTIQLEGGRYFLPRLSLQLDVARNDETHEGLGVGKVHR